MWHTRGTQKMELIFKTCVFILTCLNFSHLQSTLHLTKYTIWDIFSTAQNSFSPLQLLCLLVLLLFLVSPLPPQQNISLWGLFSPGKQKQKATQGEIRWIGRVGHGGHAILVKNCWTLSSVWAGALINPPSWNGQMCWKSLQKKFTEAEHSLSQQCQLVHYYRWVPGTFT